MPRMDTSQRTGIISPAEGYRFMIQIQNNLEL
jgi:hypothetical protein